MGLKEAIQAYNTRRKRKEQDELMPTSVMVEEVSTEIDKVISSYNRTMNAGIAYADTIMEIKAELREKAAASALPSATATATDKFMEEYFDPALTTAEAITTLESRVPKGTTVLHAGGGATVYNDRGEAVVRFGVWGDEAEESPKNNVETEEVELMDFNNADVLKQRLYRDKAIIAMHILRVTKPRGDKGKGIGPNREDHPLFREVVHMWMQGVEITGDALVKVEQARERVTKYGKQLTNSLYHGPIANEDFKRAEMLESVRHAYKEQAEAELAEALREETYGGW